MRRLTRQEYRYPLQIVDRSEFVVRQELDAFNREPILSFTTCFEDQVTCFRRLRLSSEQADRLTAEPRLLQQNPIDLISLTLSHIVLLGRRGACRLRACYDLRIVAGLASHVRVLFRVIR